MERNRVKLKKSDSELSVNEDLFGAVNLDNTSRLLPYTDITRVINENTQFNKERQACTKYRLVTSVNPLITNVLFNLTGDNSWSIFNKALFRDRSFPPNGISIDEDEDFSYSESVSYHLQEKDGWFGYYDPKLNSDNRFLFNHMKPGKDELGFITKNGMENWDITFTYPSEKLSNDLTNGGLDVIGKVSVNVGGKTMTAIAVPYKHNLELGEFVRLGDFGVFEVMRIGLDNGDFKENYFVIDLLPENVTLNNTKMTKIVKGEDVEYYFRVFKRVKTVKGDEIGDNDYDAYPLAFSKNVFGDTMTQLVTKNDIDVDGLVDNLGRPLSEIFITHIKKDDKGFTNVSSGLLLNNVPGISDRTDIPDIRRIHNGTTSHDNLNATVKFSDDLFIGDLVEFNKSTLIETTLAEVHHRFNTLNREAGGQISTTLGVVEKPILADIKPEDIWHGTNPVYEPITTLDSPAIFLFALFKDSAFISEDDNGGGYGGSSGGGSSSGGFTNNKVYLGYDPKIEICGLNSIDSPSSNKFINTTSFKSSSLLFNDVFGEIRAESGYYSDGVVTKYWDRSLSKYTTLTYCNFKPSTSEDSGSDSGSSTGVPTSLGERNEGYMYCPLHRIKIREFSNYIESGDSKTVNMPEYALKKDGDRFIWRDLMDIGENGGVDYPFLNGSHNLYVDDILALKRQDPFNEYGLWGEGVLRDIGGNKLNDKNKLNRAGDVC